MLTFGCHYTETVHVGAWAAAAVRGSDFIGISFPLRNFHPPPCTPLCRGGPGMGEGERGKEGVGEGKGRGAWGGEGKGACRWGPQWRGGGLGVHPDSQEGRGHRGLQPWVRGLGKEPRWGRGNWMSGSPGVGEGLGQRPGARGRGGGVGWGSEAAAAEGAVGAEEGRGERRERKQGEGGR